MDGEPALLADGRRQGQPRVADRDGGHLHPGGGEGGVIVYDAQFQGDALALFQLQPGGQVFRRGKLDIRRRRRCGRHIGRHIGRRGLADRYGDLLCHAGVRVCRYRHGIFARFSVLCSRQGPGMKAVGPNLGVRNGQRRVCRVAGQRQAMMAQPFRQRLCRKADALALDEAYGCLAIHTRWPCHGHRKGRAPAVLRGRRDGGGPAFSMGLFRRYRAG